MSWRRSTAQQTGANEAPLANRRAWGGASSEPGPPPPSSMNYNSQGPPGSGGGYGSRFDDRDRDSGRRSRFDDRSGSAGSRFDDRGGSYGGGGGPPPASSYPSSVPAQPAGERKKKSRWGTEKVDGGTVPVAITGGVESKDLEAFAANLRLDEISRALRTGNVVPPDGARSPSPPPIYDHQGRRTNTREIRYRRKLEDERIRLVERQMKHDPNFKPPPEYLMAKSRGAGRTTEKIYIPVKDYPEINFFGLLVGPRGNSLKRMERESGAKISIRGKGSVKEGKGRPGHEEEDNDELHCVVMADSEDKVQKCIRLINEVIATAASTPEAQNDHKRNQLRELAQLNGTLRDDENQVCQNCGNIGHRKYDCPEQRNWTANIICRVCGGAGHMARDCTQRRGPNGMPQGGGGMMPPNGGPPGGNAVDPARAQQFDSEYASLMAELGETTTTDPVAATSAAAPGQAVSTARDSQGNSLPPWRIPSNWHQPTRERQQPPQHAAYTGQSQGYSSFPQANMVGAAYMGALQPQDAAAAAGGPGMGMMGGQQQPQAAYYGGYAY